MSATGLDVFDRTLQATHRWLDDIEQTVGPDRQRAWHVLGAVLRALRDRLTLGLAVHLGAQLPLLIRGLYYEGWQPSEQPMKLRSDEEFLEHVSVHLTGIRPVAADDAVRSVFGAIDHFVDPNQAQNVREALPEQIRRLWQPGGSSATRRFERTS